jgi:hypothetical protein
MVSRLQTIKERFVTGRGISIGVQEMEGLPGTIKVKKRDRGGRG